MERQRLLSLLEELHTELGRSELDDERSRELLRSVLADIETALDRAEEEEREESLIDRLREAALEFEGSHPQLVNAVGRVVDQLAKMGI